jgi:RNA 3'-phosphate cyclase
MLSINGARGEGGGQILRTAVALSALTQTPIKVSNIRANRPKPGLSAQHLVGIKAVAKLCQASTSGLELGSEIIEFSPGKIRGGEFRFEIGTAGSITLVLQASILPALHADKNVKITITGGTDVKWSPPIDYFNNVFLTLLKKMNVNIESEIIDRGYYPKGGGKIKINIQPQPDLKRLDLSGRGDIEQISGIINLTGLPSHISDRIEKSALDNLKNFQNVNLTQDRRTSGLSQGTGITLWTETAKSVLGASALGERGLPAEKVGQSAADGLVQEIKGEGSVDIYAADQIVPYLGLAGGEFSVREITSHTKTNIWLTEQFIDDRFGIEQINDKLWKIKI